MATFAELFCDRYHVARERYVRAVFWRCLHRRALAVAPLILLINRGYFAADVELILGLGQIHSRRDLEGELADYHYHPFNRGLMRRMKIRISVARITRLVLAVLPPETRGGAKREIRHGPANSREPWAGG